MKGCLGLGLGLVCYLGGWLFRLVVKRVRKVER